MVQIEPVETTLTLDVDKQSFARGLKFARDTGKKLDQELLRELQLNVVNAENKIRQIKSQLKKDLPRERKIELEIELQGLKSGLTQAKRELRNFENTGNKTASRLQKKFNGLWSSIKASFTNAATAFAGIFAFQSLLSALGNATRAARQFEAALAKVNTVARVTDKELQGLGKEITAISQRLPVSAQELVDASFDIVSAGVNFENAAKVLEVSAQVAVGASTDTKTAFWGLIAVTKAYGLEVSEVNKVADLFFKTNELGQTTVGEVSSSIQRVATSAKLAGVSLEELFGIYSTLTGVTGDANAVTTQISGALNALSAPTTEASAKLRQLWVEVGAAAIAEKGFVTVAKEVFDAVGGNREQLRKLIPEVNALLLVETLATTQNEKFTKSVNELSDAQWSLLEAVAKQVDTNDAKLQLAENRWDNFSKSVGNAVLTAVGAIIWAFQKAGIAIDFFVESAAGWFVTIIRVVQDVFGQFGKVLDNAAVLFLLWGKNIGAALGNGIIQNLEKWLNAVNSLVTKSLNKVISSLNSVLEKVGVDAIGKLSNEDISLGVEFESEDLSKVFQKIEFAETKKQIDSTREKLDGLREAFKNAGGTVEQVKFDIAAQQLEEINKQSEELEKKDPLWNLSGAWWTALSGAKKVAKEISDLEEKWAEDFHRMNNEKIDALKDFGKAQDKIVKDQEKGIEKLNSSIAKVKATIADLDSQIANATLDEATALGERAQEIKEALTGDVSGEEARSLQAELEGIKQLGRANEEVQAAIEEAARQETLTETQKIQEKFALQKQELEAKKAIEEEKLTLLEAQLATEEELLEKNRLIQKAIQEKITNDLLTEIEKRDEAFRDSLELQRQALIWGGLSTAPGATTTSTDNSSSSTDNSTVNNVNINVEAGADSSIGQQVADEFKGVIS